MQTFEYNKKKSEKKTSFDSIYKYYADAFTNMPPERIEFVVVVVVFWIIWHHIQSITLKRMTKPNGLVEMTKAF